MEPDTLATPGDDVSARASHPKRGGAAMTPVHNGHAPPAAHPERNGNGNGHAGTARATNGHAHLEHDLAQAWAVAESAVVSGRTAATVIEHDLRAANSFYLRSGKRIMDVIGAAVALVVTSPLLLIAAIAIKLESRGPVLYRSTRIGRGGRPFTFLKLRSMVHNADQHRHRLSHLNECDGPVFKINRDPRVTRVGRFLRVTSIDEIPQFANVLMGHMSLVGPRPPIPEEVVQYEPWQFHRLDVRPGITCLWQISGRSRIGFQEWMRLDLEYIRSRSLALDVNILIRTIPAVLSREGAY
jgi:lipopolysaccharide/colanic/teichoic acid biosynthesis glycosyltransferase